jgi:hypothetical protein
MTFGKTKAQKGRPIQRRYTKKKLKNKKQKYKRSDKNGDKRRPTLVETSQIMVNANHMKLHIIFTAIRLVHLKNNISWGWGHKLSRQTKATRNKILIVATI